MTVMLPGNRCITQEVQSKHSPACNPPKTLQCIIFRRNLITNFKGAEGSVGQANDCPPILP